ELQRVAGNMASSFCHVDGVAMQFRLQRNVRALRETHERPIWDCPKNIHEALPAGTARASRQRFTSSEKGGALEVCGQIVDGVSGWSFEHQEERKIDARIHPFLLWPPCRA